MKMGSILFSKRYKPEFGRNRKKRPKSFKTEEKAKEYAKKQGIKDFKIKQLSESKYVIVQ